MNDTKYMVEFEVEDRVDLDGYVYATDDDTGEIVAVFCRENARKVLKEAVEWLSCLPIPADPTHVWQYGTTPSGFSVIVRLSGGEYDIDDRMVIPNKTLREHSVRVTVVEVNVNKQNKEG